MVDGESDADAHRKRIPKRSLINRPHAQPGNVLETVIGVLRAAGYEIKDTDRDKGHVSATKGNVDFTLTFVDQVKPCAVRWTIDKSSRPQVQDTESTTMSCVGFRPELEKALGID